MRFARTVPLLPLLLAVASAAAQTPIDRSAAVDADARVTIDNLAGSVSVRAWERNEVRIGGTLGRDVEELRVEGDARRLNIQVVYPQNGRGRLLRGGETALVVDVPRGIELAVQTVSASIDVDGVAGPSMDLRSVSGEIGVDSDTPDLRVATVSGGVRTGGAQARIAVETVSGRADVDTTSADIGVRSVSGRIAVKAGRVVRLNAATVSGSVELDIAGLDKGGRVEAETMSGSVHLTLPADLSARLEASTFSGSIRSDFGEVTRERYGPGQSLHADAGSADGQIKATAFSGTVRIQRR
ncbi:MAG TPA: DUF4097 family beta strand repeat-containing protein [Xanthomonadaceae bacterium]|nr:DUF4097 family beta strand repeat-containing protein [Xanthomonadaceae bacterium]